MGDHGMSSRLYAGNSEYPAVLVHGQVKIRPVRTISRKDSSQKGDSVGLRTHSELRSETTSPARLDHLEVLRILRGHTPTLFPVSREEEEMVRTL